MQSFFLKLWYFDHSACFSKIRTQVWVLVWLKSRKLIVINNYFFSFTTSELILKKVDILENGKPYPWYWLNLNYFRGTFLPNSNSNSIRRGGSGTYRGHPTPLTNQGLLIRYFDFLIAEVFLHEIYLAAKI